ncbi:hypothetical protein HG535_0B01700 [Zygotorulaspora mrakii]|uniref:Uncharacterized protein n=1 Tax=Zygotorulaspora mrakii TaxID=42260 RepID=A0A7H9B010_ZYGMR|nr:uncharacterized protein HG535_0B01700 [Zygotorulaspora mrakii]QLG71132.1 hypothetical protein HG535_0B01700 [Zygotorulaspora mrakii]
MKAALRDALAHQMTDQVEDPFLAYLLSTKVSENLNVLRNDLLKEQVILDGTRSNANTIGAYQKNCAQLAFEASSKKHETIELMKRKYDNYQESLKKRRYSVDFDAASDGVDPVVNLEVSEPDGLTDETAELRRRLLGHRVSDAESGIGSTKSIDRQIEDQDNLQTTLLEDMTNLVGTLRQSASAFQNALEEDRNVLSAAEIGVQIASKSLVDIGGKLKKYDKKKLGYLFYITVFLFMIIGLILTFIIIRLFPAL